MIAWVLGLSLKATLLLVGVGVVAHIVRRSAAATRHFVWISGLTLLLLLPAFILAVPDWSPRWLNDWTPAYLHAQAPASSGTDAAVGLSSSSRRTLGVDVVTERRGGGRRGAEVAQDDLGAAPVPGGDRSSATPAARSRASAAAPWLLAVWIAGALLMICWLAVGLARRTRLARDSTTIRAGAIAAAAGEAARAIGLRRGVEIKLGERQLVPMTWGVTRPVLYLPSAARRWSPRRLRAVMLHELAHVKRYDSLSRCLGQLACSVFWFHPLAWMSTRRMLREQERACDDVVIVAGADPHHYADTLLQIAREFRAPRPGVVGALAFSRRSNLELRLLSILDPLERRNKMTTLRKALVTVLFVAAALPLAALRPAAAAQEPDRAQHVVLPRVVLERIEAVIPRLILEPVEAVIPRLILEPVDTVIPHVVLEPVDTVTPRIVVEPIEEPGSRVEPARAPRAGAQISDSYRITVVQEDAHIRLEATEALRIPANVDDIELEPGGRLNLTEGDRSLEVIPSAAGGLSFRYTVDGVEQPFDDDARAWADGVLERIGEIGELRGNVSVRLGDSGARVTRFDPGDLELSIVEPLELPDIELQVALDTLEAAIEPLELSVQRMQAPLELAITLENLDAMAESLDVTVDELGTELGRMSLSLHGIEPSLEPLELSLHDLETTLEPLELSLEAIEPALELSLETLEPRLEMSLESVQQAIDRSIFNLSRFDRVESWSEDGSRFVVMRRGSVEIGPTIDDLDIGEDGDLVIDERSADGEHRRLYVYTGDGGEPVFEWVVDGEELPFGDTGRAWLRSILDRLR